MAILKWCQRTSCVDSGDTAIATVSPTTLTGVNDNERNPDDQRVTVIPLEASSGDYNDVIAMIRPVTVRDDDTPEVASDREALYNATTGANWRTSTNPFGHPTA